MTTKFDQMHRASVAYNEVSNFRVQIETREMFSKRDVVRANDHERRARACVINAREARDANEAAGHAAEAEVYRDLSRSMLSGATG